MNEQKEKTLLFKAGAGLCGALTLLALVYIFSAIKEWRYIGAGVQPTNTIMVSGEGEVYAAPDIAVITFTVREKNKKVVAAQDAVKTKVNAALKALDDLSVDKKDITTNYYSSYPKYEYSDPSCMGFPCPTYRNPVLWGYEVTQSITVKVRDIEKTGDLLEKLAAADVTEVSGPNFSIDKEDEVKNQARAKAIAQAKEKAETLAESLGVDLVRIVSFNENGDRGGIYYAKAMSATAEGGMGGDNDMSVPSGENKITSNVSITYEIR